MSLEGDKKKQDAQPSAPAENAADYITRKYQKHASNDALLIAAGPSIYAFKYPWMYSILDEKETVGTVFVHNNAVHYTCGIQQFSSVHRVDGFLNPIIGGADQPIRAAVSHNKRILVAHGKGIHPLGEPGDPLKTLVFSPVCALRVNNEGALHYATADEIKRYNPVDLRSNLIPGRAIQDFIFDGNKLRLADGTSIFEWHEAEQNLINKGKRQAPVTAIARVDGLRYDAVGNELYCTSFHSTGGAPLAHFPADITALLAINKSVWRTLPRQIVKFIGKDH